MKRENLLILSVDLERNGGTAQAFPLLVTAAFIPVT